MSEGTKACLDLLLLLHPLLLQARATKDSAKGALDLPRKLRASRGMLGVSVCVSAWGHAGVSSAAWSHAVADGGIRVAWLVVATRPASCVALVMMSVAMAMGGSHSPCSDTSADTGTRLVVCGVGVTVQLIVGVNAICGVIVGAGAVVLQMG